MSKIFGKCLDSVVYSIYQLNKMMTTISDRAIEAIRNDNRILTRLMLTFDRGEPTIRNWMRSRDVRLTTPDAVQIIQEVTGFDKSEILIDSVEA